MKARLARFQARYKTALMTYLTQGHPPSSQPARTLGSAALAAGLRSINLARMHEQTLTAEVLPTFPIARRAGLIKQAAVFFAIAVTAIEQSRSSPSQVEARARKFIETLSERAVDLAVSNLELSEEIVQRKAVEAALKTSEKHYADLLKESGRMQDDLRHLSRQILSAHEDERRKISRELHDVIAQTLTGINQRLAELKKDAVADARSLDRNISRTQRLVEQSVEIVHRFARELRPAVLDDLGLIPALLAALKQFNARTGIRTSLSSVTAVESLDGSRKTVLFRVAQEALTNIARHAKASTAEIVIENHAGTISMRVKDNGRSFRIERPNQPNARLHLGLIGMRERLEMVGGRLAISSVPGTGTTIEALVPIPTRPKRPSTKNKRPQHPSEP